MKQNTKVDYFEDTNIPSEEIKIGPVELSEMIESKLSVKGYKSKQTKREINYLIDSFNQNFGKTYKRI